MKEVFKTHTNTRPRAHTHTFQSECPTGVTFTGPAVGWQKTADEGWAACSPTTLVIMLEGTERMDHQGGKMSTFVPRTRDGLSHMEMREL